MSFPHHLVDMEVYIRNNALKYHEVPGLKACVEKRGIDAEGLPPDPHLF